MAFGPALVAVGGKVTAALMNLVLGVLTPAASYAVTIAGWSSAGSAPTTTSRYWITGNICHVMVQSILGTGAVTVGAVTVSLPVPMDTAGMISGTTALDGASNFRDISAGASGLYGGQVVMVDANTVQLMRQASASPGVVAVTSSSQPFIWAAGDELSASFSFPIA